MESTGPGIVDAHAHSDRKFSWQHSPEQLLSMMEECGIARTVLISYWDLPSRSDPDAVSRFENALKSHNEFIGFLRLNPNDPEAETLFARMVREKLVFGLKLNPATSGVAPFSENSLKLIAASAELGLPTLIHSGDDPLSNPLQIERAARSCPKSQIIMGHMGGFFYVEEAIGAAKRNKNVFLETSVMPYPQLIRAAAKDVGTQRVLFGSDAPGVHAKIEIQKIRASGLDEKKQEMILCQNFMDLIKLS